jgi:hypothetical protein
VIADRLPPPVLFYILNKTTVTAQVPAEGTWKTITRNLGTCWTRVHGLLGRAQEAQNATVMKLPSVRWKVKEKKLSVSDKNKHRKAKKCNKIKKHIVADI